MAVNKVVYGTTVLVDLTKDTVTADKLAVGVTAHGANGEKISGEMAVQAYYTGPAAPSNSVGVDGDLYLVTGV